MSSSSDQAKGNGKEVVVGRPYCSNMDMHMAAAATMPSTSAALASSSSSKRKLVLRCSDGAEFEVDESLAVGSLTIKNMIQDECIDDGPVPLPNVSGPMLAKIVQYWRHHAEGKEEGSKEMKEWDANFARIEVTEDDLFDLILAANYLDTKPLLDLLCQTVADKIKDFTVEQVRDYFDIENDFTPEEEQKIREENKWAFE